MFGLTSHHCHFFAQILTFLTVTHPIKKTKTQRWYEKTCYKKIPANPSLAKS